jgi:hypothetical protein
MNTQLTNLNPNTLDPYTMEGEITLLGGRDQPALTIKNIPNWIKNTKPGNIPYALVMDPEDTKQLLNYTNYRVSQQLSFAVVTIGLTVMSATLSFILFVNVIQLPLFFLIPVLVLAGFIYWGHRMNILPSRKYGRDAKIYQKLRPLLNDIETSALRAWLKNKYSIEVTDECLWDLYDNIWEDKGVKELVPFTDTTGKERVLARTKDDTGWIVKQAPEVVETFTESAKKLTNPITKLIHSIHKKPAQTTKA